MRTVLETLTIASEHFANAGVDSPRLTAEILLADTLCCKRIDLYLRFDQPLTEIERAQFGEKYKRRLAREPLQYILGTAEFCGFVFDVSPDVLIPRPETEQLAEEVVRLCGTMAHDSLRILDIGTGSGCIAVTVAKRFPALSVVALDVSADAIALARHNAARLDAPNIVFRTADVFHEESIPGSFDVVVSNPPYVSRELYAVIQPEVRKFEPSIAVTDNGDGLTFYKRIAAYCPAHLVEKGRIVLEIGAGQAADVRAIFNSIGFDSAVKRDMEGIQRILFAWRPQQP